MYRRMYKVISGFVIAAMLATPFPSFASDGAAINDGGITPDQALYSLDKLAENVQISMTFDSIEKAQLFLDIAEERLAESIEMVEKEEKELSEQALGEYQNTIDEVVTITDEALAEGTEVSQVTQEITEQTVEKEAIIEEILSKLSEDIRERMKESLEEVYEKAEASKEVVVLVEGVEQAEGMQEETAPTVEEEVTEVVVVDKVEDQTALEKMQGANFNARQMIAVLALADQSGKTLHEVIDIFLVNEKGIGATAKALGLNTKDALKGIKEAFKISKREVMVILQEAAKKVENEEVQAVDSINEQSTDATTSAISGKTEDASAMKLDDDEDDAIKAKALILLKEKYGKKYEIKFNEKFEKEAQKAEKKLEHTIKQADKKIGKIEEKKYKEEKKKDKAGKGKHKDND